MESPDPDLRLQQTQISRLIDTAQHAEATRAESGFPECAEDWNDLIPILYHAPLLYQLIREAVGRWLEDSLSLDHNRPSGEALIKWFPEWLYRASDILQAIDPPPDDPVRMLTELFVAAFNLDRAIGHGDGDIANERAALRLTFEKVRAVLDKSSPRP
jgi:hypothetical protein